VPASYLEQSADLDYAGNIHVAQGRTVDKAHLVVSEGMNRSQFYVGSTRAREENTIHVVTGPPDPAQPTRATMPTTTSSTMPSPLCLGPCSLFVADIGHVLA